VSDLLKKNLSFHSAVVLGVYWLVVFAVPFMIADARIKLGGLGWCLIAVLVGYFGYTGMRALKPGSKTRFVLRIVIPAALFAAASIVVVGRR
jgi:hypothetical protein